MSNVHDTTSVKDITKIEVVNKSFSFDSTFESGTTLKKIIPSNTIFKRVSPMEDGWIMEQNNKKGFYITFTDSSNTVRTIYPTYRLSGVYAFELTNTTGNYRVNSDIVWTIPMIEYTVPVTKYKITQTLSNSTSDCSITEIESGSSITITVSPNDGYEFSLTPTCEMGSTAIVASQLETGYSFVIESVNGEIIVVAEATSVIPTEVNNTDFGFINIYNPTKNELKEASTKWFYNMSKYSHVDLSKYIAALFITYGKPLVLTEKETIKFSSYDTEISAHVVREPKIEVDCGTITVEEVYHNALDYSPNSSVRIFLPFIGYENIDIDLIMDSELSLKYVIDCLSGKCIAKLQCNKSGGVFDIYTFVGDCSLQVPYYMNNTENNSNTIITRAYNLDDRTPFLLIERASAYMPNSSRLDGVSSNEVAILGDLTGYTKCKEVSVYGIDCTSAEKNEIENLLKRGVIL